MLQLRRARLQYMSINLRSASWQSTTYMLVKSANQNCAKDGSSKTSAHTSKKGCASRGRAQVLSVYRVLNGQRHDLHKHAQPGANYHHPNTYRKLVSRKCQMRK